MTGFLPAMPFAAVEHLCHRRHAPQHDQLLHRKLAMSLTEVNVDVQSPSLTALALSPLSSKPAGEDDCITRCKMLCLYCFLSPQYFEVVQVMSTMDSSVKAVWPRSSQNVFNMKALNTGGLNVHVDRLGVAKELVQV